MSVKISELPVLDTLADNDVLAGVDTSANVTSKVTLSSLKQYIDTNTTYTGGTNIDITNNVVSAPNVYSKTETDNLLSAKESLANKITSISSSSTNAQYPSAKSVYNHVSTTKTQIEETLGDAINNTKGELDGDIEQLNNEIEELQSEIDSLSMIYNAFPTESDEDESMTLDGTAEVKFKKFNLKGNTSQDGTPTPTSPIPVNVVSGDNEISVTSKNRLGYPSFSSILADGITFTNNKGIYTISGTSSTAVNTGNYNVPKYIIQEGDYIHYNNDFTDGHIGYTLLFSDGTVCFTSFSSNVNKKVSLSQYIGKTIVGMRFNFNSGYTFNGTCSPMIVKSSTSIPFEEYVGDTYNIDLPVENLFNKNTTNILNAYLSGTTINGYANNRTIYIPVNQGTTYTINKIVGSGGLIYAYSSTEPIIGGTTFGITTLTAKMTTLTAPTNAKYLCVTIYRDSDSSFTVDDVLGGLQIEKGSKANSYTPFGTTPIELCKIGNYQDYIYKDSDKWYLHKEIGKKLYNGSENWTYKTNDGTNYCFADPDITGYYHGETILGLSNYFSKVVRCSGYANALTQGIGIYFYYLSTSADFNSLYIVTNTSTTANDLKTWLSTHNTEVYYQLATPTNIEITYQPLIDQLNLLEKAMSKEGQTNIGQFNNDKPFIINAEAILSLQNVLDRVTLLES